MASCRRAFSARLPASGGVQSLGSGGGGAVGENGGVKSGDYFAETADVVVRDEEAGTSHVYQSQVVCELVAAARQ